ncbi:MAG: hypothetical protein EPN23_05935 [Verrucomicrobia bacterium]|nr:MAG: hypothetical protein EPN23_05935 [Verrucomicrobiota bacterium]
MAAVLIVMAALYLGLPYRSLDSDVATFGLMGEDLYRLGYLPTLTYGQNYIFSLTPYLYTFFRFVLPADTPTPITLALAGSVLSLSGLWLVYESFLAVWRRSATPHPITPLLFCILLLASPLYIFDLSRNSSIELSLFTLGGLMFAASRIFAALHERKAPSPGWWVLAGAMFAYAAYSRPQICLVGLFLLLPLAYQLLRNVSASAGFRTVFWLLAGGVLGWLPLLLHRLWRAPLWPFPTTLATHLNSWHGIREACQMLGQEILPAIFGLNADHPLRYAVIALWLGSALVAFFIVLKKRKADITVLDYAWLGGFLTLLLIMALETNLTRNATGRRYCLHIYLAAVWLFCRFAVRPGWRNYAVALTAAVTLFSIPRWIELTRAEWQDNLWIKAVQNHLIPELRAQHAVILANYWDAYLLAFLARGQLPIEAVPWDWVRTYGLLRENELRGRTLWFVSTGYGHSTADQLRAHFGPKVLEHKTDLPLQTKYFGRACELWQLPADADLVALMKKCQPRYFTTPYPPGARHDLRKNL